MAGCYWPACWLNAYLIGNRGCLAAAHAGLALRCLLSAAQPGDVPCSDVWLIPSLALRDWNLSSTSAPNMLQSGLFDLSDAHDIML